MSNKKMTEEELLEGLNADTAHADELAELLQQELHPPLSYKKPTIEELKAAHAAESKVISDKIAAGYDFKKEKQTSVFRKMAQKRRDIVERERATRKLAEEKK